MLTAPRGVSPLLVRVGGVLFYFGIGVFLAGAVLRYARRIDRRFERKSAGHKSETLNIAYIDDSVMIA